MADTQIGLLGTLPELLMERADRALLAQQRATLELWKAIAAAYDAVAPLEREFFADQLALMLNVHPATSRGLLVEVLGAHELPALMESWEASELTERHVRAGVDELRRCLHAPALRARALDRVLTRCRERRVRHGWPTPGEFRRMLRAAAILLDLDAHREREKRAREDRGVDTLGLPDGQACLTLTGPAAEILAAA
jgi:hypothetical protein